MKGFKQCKIKYNSVADLITYLIHDMMEILFPRDLIRNLQKTSLIIIESKKILKFELEICVQKPFGALKIPAVIFYDAPIVFVEVQKSST